MPNTSTVSQLPYSGDLVSPSVAGLVAANPYLGLLKHNVVVRRASYQANNKVTLVSGGGSGHEPAHAGFVGDGMLDAVAAGQIFASPSAVQIDHAMDAVIRQGYLGDCQELHGRRAAFWPCCREGESRWR